MPLYGAICIDDAETLEDSEYFKWRYWRTIWAAFCEKSIEGEMMEKIEMYHIEYEKPKVTLLQQSGLGVAEIAARTCYDSFENSENECVKTAMEHLDTDAINNIDDSDLLSNLAWVHHHNSIIEHATLSFLVQGTSR